MFDNLDTSLPQAKDLVSETWCLHPQPEMGGQPTVVAI